MCAVDQVLDVGLSQTLIRVGRTNVDGVVHEATSQSHDGARHGCGEQHGVTLGRSLRENLLDVGQEAEVEHLVCLIENDFFDLCQGKQTLVGEVKKTTGGSDHNLGACLELLYLAFVGLSTVDRNNLGFTVGGGQFHVFSNLNTQFTGGNNNKHLHTGAGVGSEALNDGQTETEGLTGTGLGLANDVLTTQSEGDGLLLNGEGLKNSL